MGDKKAIILVALVVVLGGVGVFQFTKGPKNTPRPNHDARTKAIHRTDEKSAGQGEPIVVAVSGQKHDPFAPVSGANNDTDASRRAIMENMKKIAKSDGSAPVVPHVKSGGGLKPIGTQLHDPEPNKGTPGQPKIEEKPVLNGCGWDVAGIVLGPRPMVVLKDESGQQVLARQGQQVDGNTKIVAISDRFVSVKHMGKEIRLAIGGGVTK